MPITAEGTAGAGMHGRDSIEVCYARERGMQGDDHWFIALAALSRGVDANHSHP